MCGWQATREKRRGGRDKHSRESFGLKCVSSVFPERERRISQASVSAMNYCKKPVPVLSEQTNRTLRTARLCGLPLDQVASTLLIV